MSQPAEEDVVRYLGTRGVLPGGASVPEVLSKLSTRTPKELLLQVLPAEGPKLLQDASRLELENKAEELRAEMKRVTEDGKERLVRETRTLPTIYGAIMGVLVLVIGGMTALGWAKYHDVGELERRTQELSRSVDEQQKAVSKTLLSVQNSRIVLERLILSLPLESLIADTEFAMNSVTLSFVDEATVSQAGRTASLIDKALELKEDLPPDTFVLLDYLRELNGNVVSLAEYNRHRDPAKLEELLKRWLKTSAPSVSADNPYADFFKRAASHTSNIRGVLFVAKYDSADVKGDPELLEEAKWHITNATKLWERNARAYSHLAVIEKRYLEAMDQRTFELVEAPVREILALYMEGLHNTSDAKIASTINNNRTSLLDLIADEALRAANTARKNQDQKGEEQYLASVSNYLSQAEEALDDARRLTVASPTLRITWAEYDCISLAAARFRGDVMTKEMSEKTLKRILDRIRSAVRDGFDDFRDLSDEKFSSRFPYFRHLALLDTDYAPELMRAAGIAR